MACKHNWIFIDDSWEDDSSSGYYICSECDEMASIEQVEGDDE